MEKKIILIAEDDRFLANALRIKLSNAGYDVVIASDGDEALDKLKEQKFDLVLLDLIMPRKDGFTVLSEMKKEESGWKSIPVIVASNLGQKEDIDRAMSLGADSYIVKSQLQISDVVKMVGGILGN